MPVRSELTEPTLEELSAYVDDELDGTARLRIEQHLETCADCRARVDGLRETAHAVRALPMESPPRSFSIPPQRRPSFRWAPVGWLGAAAAAVLVIVVGVHQVYNPTGTPTASTASNAEHYSALAPASRSVPSPTVGAAGAASQLDQHAPSVNSLANWTSVGDPRNTTFSLELSTDSAAYAASGKMTVRVKVNGLTAGQVTSVRLLLERNGYAVELPTPSSVSAGFQATYSLGKLALSNPVQGTYTLLAIEQLPSGDGATLVARLQIAIQ